MFWSTCAVYNNQKLKVIKEQEAKIFLSMLVDAW